MTDVDTTAVSAAGVTALAAVPRQPVAPPIDGVAACPCRVAVTAKDTTTHNRATRNRRAAVGIAVNTAAVSTTPFAAVSAVLAPLPQRRVRITWVNRVAVIGAVVPAARITTTEPAIHNPAICNNRPCARSDIDGPAPDVPAEVPVVTRIRRRYSRYPAPGIVRKRQTVYNRIRTAGTRYRKTATVVTRPVNDRHSDRARIAWVRARQGDGLAVDNEILSPISPLIDHNRVTVLRCVKSHLNTRKLFRNAKYRRLFYYCRYRLVRVHRHRIGQSSRRVVVRPCPPYAITRIGRRRQDDHRVLVKHPAHRSYRTVTAYNVHRQTDLTCSCRIVQTHINHLGVIYPVGPRRVIIKAKIKRRGASGIDTYTVHIVPGLCVAEVVVRQHEVRVQIDIAPKPVERPAGLPVHASLTALDITVRDRQHRRPVDVVRVQITAHRNLAPVHPRIAPQNAVNQ